MGQQQLLLLVLGIVVVGLAVVVGIQAFDENSKKANLDALVNDGVRVATSAQEWKLKAAALGGGADTDDFAVGFSDLGLPADTDDEYETPSGTFNLTPVNMTGFVAQIAQRYGVDQTGQALVIYGENATYENAVVVLVFGPEVSHVVTKIPDNFIQGLLG